jgi:hypothetical protein
MWVWITIFFAVATILSIAVSIFVIKARRRKENKTEPPIKPKKHWTEYIPRADSVESELTGVMSAVISAEKLKEKAIGDSKKVKETPKAKVVKPEPAGTPEPVILKPTPSPLKTNEEIAETKELEETQKAKVKTEKETAKKKSEKDVIKGLFAEPKSPETKKKDLK